MDQEILNLKTEGKSLREIGRTLGLSPEGVRKRLKKLSTKSTPSIGTGPSVNSYLKAMESIQSGLQIATFDLSQAIIDFLKGKGLEVYRLKTEPEAYQVKYNSQVIRFYVSKGRGDPSDKSQ